MLGHQHESLEVGDQNAVLVKDACLHLHQPSIRLRSRRPYLQNLGLGKERVTVEDRVG